MKKCRTIAEIRDFSRINRKQGRTIGFVPTMGYLHDGHLSLVDVAKNKSDIVIVSIFVNPTQFAPNEDLETYPRNMERDMKLCKEHGVDALFFPSAEEYYQPDASTWVIEQDLGKDLCGTSRPGHFKGVTTVVAKLFNSVLPDIAVFGEKDFQQAAIIKRMVRDLNFPVEIITVKIVREKDGLAMSSRNKYLSVQERQNALSISRSLFKVKDDAESGLIENSVNAVNYIKHKIEESDGKIDYIKVVNPDTLTEKKDFSGGALIAVAAYFGKTRLIDNQMINLKEI
jgi:pantoate--beta-alanine ligase